MQITAKLLNLKEISINTKTFVSSQKRMVVVDENGSN
jgi:hypothetical protein